MGGKTNLLLLAGIFGVVLALRLYFAFSTPNLNSDEAYFHIRQVEHISETGLPLIHDSLGTGGRQIIQSPLFDYFLATGLTKPISFKILPNIFAALLIVPVFLIVSRLTKSTAIRLLFTLLAGLVPVFFIKTFNHLSPMTATLPIFFFLTYAFLRTPEKNWTIAYLALLVLFAFLHSTVFIFIFGLLIYLLITRLGRIESHKAEPELIIFSFFFAVWAQFLVHKKLILFHGPGVVWQNIPTELLSSHFAELTFFKVFWLVGLVPLLTGIYALYTNLFKEKSKEVYLLFGLIASTTVLLWFKLIEFATGLMILGVILIILSAKGFADLAILLEKTKLARFKTAIMLFGGLIFASSILLPTLSGATQELSQAVSDDEIAALNWLAANSPENSTILANWNEGHLITAIAKRKNILDSYFFLQPDAGERLADIKRAYTTQFQTEAVQLMDKYNASYIYLSPKTQKFFKKETLNYTEPPCFKLVYSNAVKIFAKNPECHIKVVGVVESVKKD